MSIMNFPKRYSFIAQALNLDLLGVACFTAAMLSAARAYALEGVDPLLVALMASLVSVIAFSLVYSVVPRPSSFLSSLRHGIPIKYISRNLDYVKAHGVQVLHWLLWSIANACAVVTLIMIGLALV